MAQSCCGGCSSSKRRLGELCVALEHSSVSPVGPRVGERKRMHASVLPLEFELPPAIAAASRATPGELQDRQLTARVKAALIAAGEITAKQILIETANSIVSLSGPVDSETMKRATLATARSVHGVVSVL